MKRKLWSVALILCLIALLSAGSLAYFTTSGTADNVITAGNLRARLVEQTADAQPLFCPVVTVQYPHSYGQKSIENCLRQWDFCLHFGN